MPNPVPPRRRAPRRVASGLVALALGLATAAAPSAAPPASAAPEWSPSMCRSFNPSDPNASSPSGNAWHVDRLEYDKLDMLGMDGSGVTIAIIDTGVNWTTAEMYEDSDITTENFAPILENDSNKNADGEIVALDCDHASFVLGLLSAQGGVDDRTDFRGIAPGAAVISMRALEGETPASRDPEQQESLDPTIEAIGAAVDADVDIISISQSGGDRDDYRAAVARAVDAGILVVAAAGNQGPNFGNSYPAAYPGVMAVGMTTTTDAPDPQSQSGPEMEISVAAPGGNLTSAVPMCVTGVDNGCTATPADQGAYLVETGTSFATPLVTGTAALVMQRYPEMTAAEVRKRLEETADPPGAAVPDKLMGHGIINPYRALVAPVGPGERTATPQPVEPSRYAPPPPADTTLERNIALGVAGTALGIVGVAAVVTAALPSGRSRRWRPARRE